MIIYVSIGNSDGKLSHGEWSDFWHEANDLITNYDRDPLDESSVVHGAWHSAPAMPWVNACWCIDVDARKANRLKNTLRDLAARYRQDAIFWAECPNTEFLAPPKGH